MIEMKKCPRCFENKVQDTEFYTCQGRYRTECKTCTIRRNMSHQRKTKPWLNRVIDKKKVRKYMRKYYSKNKERYAEYRKEFKEKNPTYHKDYQKMLKQKVLNIGVQHHSKKRESL